MLSSKVRLTDRLAGRWVGRPGVMKAIKDGDVIKDIT